MMEPLCTAARPIEAKEPEILFVRDRVPPAAAGSLVPAIGVVFAGWSLPSEPRLFERPAKESSDPKLVDWVGDTAPGLILRTVRQVAVEFSDSEVNTSSGCLGSASPISASSSCKGERDPWSLRLSSELGSTGIDIAESDEEAIPA